MHYRSLLGNTKWCLRVQLAPKVTLQAGEETVVISLWAPGHLAAMLEMLQACSVPTRFDHNHIKY